MVEGTEQVVVTMVFDVPVGVDPEVVKKKITECVTVSVGMIHYLRETNQETRARKMVEGIAI